MTGPTIAVVALLLSSPAPAQDAWPALQRADWAAYSYEMHPDECIGDSVIVAEVRAKGKPSGRVAFNIVDESNYHALDIARDAVRFLRVESGLELPIGESVGKGLGGGTQKLQIRRTGSRYEAFVGGRLAALAADSTFVVGKAATGSRNGTVEFTGFYLQDTEAIFLQDDFMRADEESGGWETISGDWKVQAVGSPTRSTNAFNLGVESAPKGALTVCGAWFWRAYEAAVSCQPHGEGQIGLVAHYEGPKSYYLFTIGKSTPKADSEARIAVVSRGKPRMLATSPFALAPDQWYRLSVRISGGVITGLVDGRPVATAQATGPISGRAGLYALSESGATFDDFAVNPCARIDTGRPMLASWRPIGGEWRETDEGSIEGTAHSDAKLLFAERIPGQVSISTRVSSGAEVGLVANWQDDANYDLLTYGGEPLSIACASIRDGAPVEETSAGLDGASEAVELELTVLDEALIGRVGGEAHVRCRRPDSSVGRTGLLVRDGEASFEAPTVRRLPALAEVANFEGAFSQEVSMADWAAENSDWITIDPQTGDPGPSYWHRATSYGDHEMSVRMATAPPGPVSVMLGASAPGARDGYRLIVTPGADGSAAILLDDKPVVTRALPGLTPGATGSVALRERRGMLVGLLNGRPVVTHETDDDPTGRFCGWVAPPGVAQPSGATFRAEGVLSYNFRQAPSDWWVGGGEWKITNRWDCEPRWTFFVGGGSGVSSLWNKREFGGDVTLDFYGAIRFDSTKGYNYPHAANINCTIAADGRDLSSGYSLIYGGWDNQYTRLLRGNEVVAESADQLIPRTSSIHRRWFNLRIAKAGDTVRCWLDGTKLFEYTDPEPLKGEHVALWTYDNAITLARCRISSNAVTAGSLPPPERAPLCVYDVAAPEATQ